MRKRITTVLIFVLVCVFGFSGYKIYTILKEEKQSEGVYEELNVLAPALPQAVTELSSEETQEKEENNAWDYSLLSEINPDFWGWLRIDGTVINYPVVQGEDNSYYLNHLFNGDVNKSGCLFLDSAASPELADKNSSIFGHHMKNGTMFKALANYKKQAFFDEHPTATLFLPNGTYTVSFFAGYVCKTDADAWQRSFADDAEFTSWLSSLQKKSMFKSDIKPTVDDRIITLSTCSYEYDDARFVLHGVISCE